MTMSMLIKNFQGTRPYFVHLANGDSLHPAHESTTALTVRHHLTDLSDSRGVIGLRDPLGQHTHDGHLDVAMWTTPAYYSRLAVGATLPLPHIEKRNGPSTSDEWPPSQAPPCPDVTYRVKCSSRWRSRSGEDEEEPRAACRPRQSAKMSSDVGGRRLAHLYGQLQSAAGEPVAPDGSVDFDWMWGIAPAFLDWVVSTCQSGRCVVTADQWRRFRHLERTGRVLQSQHGPCPRQEPSGQNADMGMTAAMVEKEIARLERSSETLALSQKAALAALSRGRHEHARLANEVCQANERLERAKQTIAMQSQNDDRSTLNLYVHSRTGFGIASLIAPFRVSTAKTAVSAMFDAKRSVIGQDLTPYLSADDELTLAVQKRFEAIQRRRGPDAKPDPSSDEHHLANVAELERIKSCFASSELTHVEADVRQCAAEAELRASGTTAHDGEDGYVSCRDVREDWYHFICAGIG